MRAMVIVSACALALGSASVVNAQGQISRVVSARNSATSLRLTPLLTIGSLSGANDAFGRIMSVTSDSRGRIYVADDQQHRVTVFGPDGRFVQHLGRSGSGPGEFVSPWKVAIDRNDSLFVWDAGQSRVTVFTPDLTYHRDFRLRPQWVVNSFMFLPDGRLLLAAYGRSEPGAIHILTRDGVLQRTFGPRVAPQNLAGYEGSLLGGHIDIRQRGFVYSSKSPYEISFYDMSGTLLRTCRGQEGWTTRPADVVVSNESGDGLRWDKYIHSSNIIALSGDTYLNVIHDPVNKRRILDLITSDCVLQKRTVIAAPMEFAEGTNNKLLATRSIEYPEVIVYQMQIVR